MSEYPEAVVTLEDLGISSILRDRSQPAERPTIEVKIEADPYGISLILPGGEEFYLEYHAGRCVLSHYEYLEDENPKTLYSREPK